MDIDAYHARIRKALRAHGLPETGSVQDCVQRLSTASSEGKRKAKRPRDGSGPSTSEMYGAVVSKKLARLSSKLLSALATELSCPPTADAIAKLLVE